MLSSSIITEENAYTFGDKYAGTEGGKDDPWDEGKNGYNPSRNDGSKGSDLGANGLSHVTLTSAAGETGITTVKPAESANGAKYNLAGQQVDDTYKGVVIQNGKKSTQK